MADQHKDDPNRKPGQQGGRDRDTIKHDEARRREARNRAVEEMKKGEEGSRPDRSKDASRLPD